MLQALRFALALFVGIFMGTAVEAAQTQQDSRTPEPLDYSEDEAGSTIKKKAEDVAHVPSDSSQDRGEARGSSQDHEDYLRRLDRANRPGRFR